MMQGQPHRRPVHGEARAVACESNPSRFWHSGNDRVWGLLGVEWRAHGWGEAWRGQELN